MQKELPSAIPNEFDGRIALVTAAAGQGIGRAIAKRLAAGGARVVITDIHERRTSEVAASLAEEFPKTTIVGFAMDAGDRRQIDEVSSTHNLEHGSVIVWWDPARIDNATAGEIGTWASSLNASGFRRDASGVGIITSPFDDPGIGTDKAVAFRAWGVAMDCDTWDETVAHAFALDHFGTHGIGPERQIAPFPDGVLAYEDREVTDTSEEDAPIEGLTPEEGMEELDPEDREGVVREDEGDAEGSQETDGDEG